MRLRGVINTSSETVVISGAAIGDDAGAAGSGTGPARTRPGPPWSTRAS